MASLSAAAVANAFLDIQSEDSSNYPPIDQMKIQKLVFYAHAWWLAFKGEPLFDDDIEAWPWGPVVRNLYGQFKDCGRAPITTERATELIRVGDDFLSFRFSKPAPPGQDVMTFLRSVWDSHKALSGIQLSNSTHAPGEPWTIVKEQYGSLEGKPRIPNELIREVFQAKIPRRDGGNSASATPI